MLIRRLKIKFLVSLLLSLILLITIFSTPVFASNDSDQARQSAKEILKQKKFSNQKNDAPLSKDFKRLSDWLGENKGSQKRISTEKRIQQTQQQSKPSNLSLPNLSGVGTILLIILVPIIATLIINNHNCACSRSHWFFCSKNHIAQEDKKERES